MPLFEIKSLSQTTVLEDAAADYRAARRAEQYRLSDRAIYLQAFPGTRYGPFAAVDRAISRNTSMPLTGCCGKALPMVRLRLFYDGEFYQDFLLEKLSSADRVLDALEAVRPEARIERETGHNSPI